MGPLFNPLYWLFGIVALAAAVCVAIVVGAIIYVVSSLLMRKRLKTRAARIGLPVAILVVTMPVVFCLTLGSLCQWSLRGPPSPRGRPAEEDIEGVWVLDQPSLERIQHEGYHIDSPPIFELNSDGTFAADSIPDFSHDTLRWEFDSGAGTWEVARDIVNREWAIELHYTMVNGQAADLVTYLDLLGHGSPYSIAIWVDYDAGDALVFGRQGTYHPY
jgi:hypothetical protein